MKHIYALTLSLICLYSYAQNSLNVSFQGKLGYMGPTFDNRNILADIWGYADGNGNEYALVGTRGGFSVVDVTNANNPVQKFFIPGATSTWRDIKTYSHYAYVVHDGFSAGPSDGILIVDMDSVNQASPKFSRFFPIQTIDTVLGEQTYNRAHNIYIDENGILYLFGSNFGAGGAMMFDLTQDPEAPSFAGFWNDQYLHDGMARGDTLWGAAILAGQFFGIDVSNKSNPLVLGSQVTPNTFSHNVWISDDNKTIYNTDEVSGAFVASYDVSDLNNIDELDRIQTSLGDSGVIPHNTHVYGDFLVTSYYTSGLQIVDATHPDILIEVGYYDTSPNFINSGFNGAWGAYPYLPSGKVLVSDMEEGLYVLDAAYLKGCYFDVTVVDSVTQLTIPGADIEVLNNGFAEQTDIFGNLRFGFEAPNTYSIVASKPGYKTDTLDVVASRGVMNTERIALLPLDFSIEENALVPYELYPNPSKDAFHLNLVHHFSADEVVVSIFNMSGKEVFNQTLEVGERQVNHQLQSGIYLVKLQTKDATFAPKRLVIQ